MKIYYLKIVFIDQLFELKKGLELMLAIMQALTLN